jgi:hypothetical protein
MRGVKMKTNPENYFGASSSVSGLKVQILDAIWETIGVHLKEKMMGADSKWDQQKYYDLNRKIGDALDEFITVIGAEYRADFTHHKEDQRENIHHVLSRQIADEILKSEFVGVRELGSDYTPQRIFKVEVPLLTLTRTKRG